MTLRVLVIGGYGNFGSIVCRHLAVIPGISLVISGRDSLKLSRQVDVLDALAGVPCASWCGDAMAPGFNAVLASRGIQLVIHTGGPFQGQSYAVAQACIEAGANYCDLADCRTFVNAISVLDEQAKAAGVSILSGCSSVPTLSSAIVDSHRARFKRIDTIEHGISSSAKMPGLSTVKGVLAYAGRPIKQLKNGQVHEVLGWQGLTLRSMPPLGWRVLANVDVPDMDIFAGRYGAHTLRFKAGAGLKLGGVANFLLAQAVKVGWVNDPTPWAVRLHRWGTGFERLGDGKSAMYLDVEGVGVDDQPLSMTVQLTAFNDQGPQIPSCASVALAIKMLNGYLPSPGARACVGEITVDEYLAAINDSQNLQMSVRFSEGQR
ncbi:MULTISPECIES: saccharopine dehydrogenase family protein [unclassified Pseudomonas]|uniref:saccharopine dehydrogenase family protein n=1 Tax=unclassified Pseudomonas TaxID=196821 RepID=UPI002AC935E4|nr:MULTISPECIES: saccharopine dehydrogenase NADP-binding domain-containing protein [unclassified Pseudomonas]MEB0045906.1 saccharopine dehydrogenase NADP-binding domain-containing protein [Pseudomonas sp. Dout3]MEB0097166.1 saccharopine dehydrogenase NADP-binding domain-containing protein [Pseudomonas sp. DC1.2]WPX56896.1 saccharopine dehydrogenase NADP-binding domain-containing protein [Pseudomonas sp. DC1.2]